MLTACERRLLAFYLANAASSLHHRDGEAAALAEWVADRENRIASGSGRKRHRTRRTDPEARESESNEFQFCRIDAFQSHRIPV